MPEALKLEKIHRLAMAGVIVVFLLLCSSFLEISPADLLTSFPRFLSFFFVRFLPPDFSQWQTYVPQVLDTIFFAVVATYLSAGISVLNCLLMSERVNPVRWLRSVVRIFVSFLRNVPVMIWASILVYAFGVGELVGLIALIFMTVGFLSRSLADSLNEIDERNLECLRAAGASPFQVLWHGTLVLFQPALVDWILYCFEINIRSSAILGLVGAGGVGVLIQTSIRLFQYRQAMCLILIVIAMVLLTEWLTNKVRARVV